MRLIFQLDDDAIDIAIRKNLDDKGETDDKSFQSYGKDAEIRGAVTVVRKK